MQKQHYRKKRRHTGIWILGLLLVMALAALAALRFLYESEAAVNFDLPQNIMDVFSADTQVAEIKIDADIIASNAYVMNAGTSSAVYDKNANTQIAPASTAKLLAALTALDYLSPDDVVTVGTEIETIAEDSSRAWLTLGDKMTVRQLLIALLLPSGNDAAYTLVESTGLGAPKFVDAMNRKAKELGAGFSNFVTPDGYDAEGQYTTAFDLAQIAKVCLENETISEIVSGYASSETWHNGREVTYYNTNELLNPNGGYYYPKAIGMKTGGSSAAGQCLVSAAVINGETYICVVMDSTGEGRFADSLAIYYEIEGSG